MVSANELDLLTIREAAEILRVSEVTISRWLKQGRLPAYRLGPRAVRIRRDDLERLLTPTGPEAAPVRVLDPDNPIVLRRPTREEAEQGLAALREARKFREEMLAQRGGIPLSSSAEIIAEERRKRGEQLSR